MVNMQETWTVALSFCLDRYEILYAGVVANDHPTLWSRVVSGYARVNFLHQIFLANQFSYFVVCPTLKISIICFYRRIFSVPMFQKITMMLNCLVAAWGTGIFLACALQCRPLKAFWDRSINGHCFNLDTFIIVNQAFNVVVDFVILFLPVPMIWRLHMGARDKIALNGVFALGGL